MAQGHLPDGHRRRSDRTTGSYTVAGTGILRMAPASGSARLASLQGNHTVALPLQRASPEPGYAGWAWQEELGDVLTGSSAPRSNPDHDSLPNAFERILGGNPLQPDSAGYAPQVSTAGNNLMLTFSRDDESEGSAQCYVEYGSDLGTWSEAAIGSTGSGSGNNGITIAIEENGPSPDSVAVILPFSLTTQTRLFARLKTVLE